MGQRWEHFVTAPKVTASTRCDSLAAAAPTSVGGDSARLFSEGNFFLIGSLSREKSEPHAVGAVFVNFN